MIAQAPSRPPPANGPERSGLATQPRADVVAAPVVLAPDSIRSLYPPSYPFGSRTMSMRPASVTTPNDTDEPRMWRASRRSPSIRIPGPESSTRHRGLSELRASQSLPKFPSERSGTRSTSTVSRSAPCLAADRRSCRTPGTRPHARPTPGTASPDFGSRRRSFSPGPTVCVSDPVDPCPVVWVTLPAAHSARW